MDYLSAGGALWCRPVPGPPGREDELHGEGNARAESGCAGQAVLHKTERKHIIKKAKTGVH